MTDKNKIPTDEEIPEQICVRRKICGVALTSYSSTDEIPLYYAEALVLEAMAQARAAGREEQKERDAVILEKRAEQLKTRKDFENEAAELELQTKIIRAQGEGEK